jgi:hypothetical protein
MAASNQRPPFLCGVGFPLPLIRSLVAPASRRLWRERLAPANRNQINRTRKQFHTASVLANPCTIRRFRGRVQDFSAVAPLQSKDKRRPNLP